MDLCEACRNDLPYHQNSGNSLSAFNYHYPIDKMIQKFKFHGQLAYGKVLGQLLANYIAKNSSARPDVIIPVPLHKTRIKERGFNQAEHLARSVGKTLGIPVNTRLCTRVKKTLTQSKLHKHERSTNMESAFHINPKVLQRLKDKHKNLHIVIVDDVVTTGSTTNELTATLQRSGVDQVGCWTLSKTEFGPMENSDTGDKT